MRLSRAEQETVITYNGTREAAEIYTCDPVLMRSLEDRGLRPDGTSQDGPSRTYRVPKSWVRIVPPRQASERQREAGKANLTRHRQNAR